MLCMAHITLSVPDTVYQEMKKHPEIKWSEVARQSIIQKTMLLKNSMHIQDLFKLLPLETQKSIESADEKKSKDFYKKVRRRGWERAKYLTQA
jgi:hypothetical protein